MYLYVYYYMFTIKSNNYYSLVTRADIARDS